MRRALLRVPSAVEPVTRWRTPLPASNMDSMSRTVTIEGFTVEDEDLVAEQIKTVLPDAQVTIPEAPDDDTSQAVTIVVETDEDIDDILARLEDLGDHMLEFLEVVPSGSDVRICPECTTTIDAGDPTGIDDDGTLHHLGCLREKNFRTN